MSLTCEQYQLSLSAHFDGETWDGPPMDQVRRHVEQCPACQAFQADIEKLHRVTTQELTKPFTLKLSFSPPTERQTPQGDIPLWLSWLTPKVLVPAMGLLALIVFVSISVFQAPPTQVWQAKFSTQTVSSHQTITLKDDATGQLQSASGLLKVWAGPAVLSIGSLSEPQLSLRLDSGSCCFQWEKRQTPQKIDPIVLRVGPATIKALGTAWRATLNEDQRIDISVSEGLLQVSTKSSRQQVQAMQSLRIDAEGRIGKPEPFNPMADPDFQRGMKTLVGER